MNKINLNAKTAAEVLIALNKITKSDYFTIEIGYSKEALCPLGDTANLINWVKDTKDTFKSVAATIDSNKFSSISLSRKPSHSCYGFLAGTDVYISEDQIVFRSTMPKGHNLGNFLYHKISIETDNPKQKYELCCYKYHHENETTYNMHVDFTLDDMEEYFKNVEFFEK